MDDNQKKLKKLSQNAFTLLELIISISILSSIFMAVMGIYLYSFSTQQKSLGSLNIQEDGQFLMNIITQDIRTGKVKYDYYPSGQVHAANSSTSTLALTVGTSTIVYQRVASGAINVIQRSDDGGSTFQTMTMSTLNIKKMDFRVYPITNPEVTSSTTYYTPRVNVVLELDSTREKVGDRTARLQQTVPQRFNTRK